MDHYLFNGWPESAIALLWYHSTTDGYGDLNILLAHVEVSVVSPLSVHVAKPASKNSGCDHAATLP